MISLRPGCMVRTICEQLVTSCLYLGFFATSLPTSPPQPTLPFLPPAHPLVTLGYLQKNSLKRPKSGTTSKVNCILFNRLLSPVLLNKSGLVQAKAGNFNLKSLNKCFSNYYQVRTRPVFADGHIWYYAFVMYLIIVH